MSRVETGSLWVGKSVRIVPPWAVITLRKLLLSNFMSRGLVEWFGSLSEYDSSSGSVIGSCSFAWVKMKLCPAKISLVLLDLLFGTGDLISFDLSFATVCILREVFGITSSVDSSSVDSALFFCRRGVVAGLGVFLLAVSTTFTLPFLGLNSAAELS